MIRIALTAVAAAAVCATPAFAQFPGQAPAAGGFPGQTGFQVTRPTDAAMTCEQILAEANPLNETVQAQKQAAAAKLAEEQAAAQRAASGRRIGGALLGGALSLGAQAGMMGGMMNSAAGRQAFAAANQGANAVVASANAPAAAPVAGAAPPSVEEQRMAVLLALYTEKRCGG